MKPQTLNNDIYDRFKFLDEFEIQPQLVPPFNNCFEKIKINHRQHQLKTLKQQKKQIERLNQKIVVPKPFNFPAFVLNNEYVKEKYTGNFVQVSPSKLQSKKQKQIRHISSDNARTTKTNLQKNTGNASQYYTISQNTKNALDFVLKKKNSEEYQSFLKKKAQRWPQLNITHKMKPIHSTTNPIKKVSFTPPIPEEDSAKSISNIRKLEFPHRKQSEKKTPVPVPNLQYLRKPKVELAEKKYQLIAEEQRKNKIQVKKQISQEYAKPFNPPSNVSAYAFMIYEPDFSQNSKRIEKSNEESPKKKFQHSHKIVASQNSRSMVQVASLTKIMTCILAIDICKQKNLNSTKINIDIGKFEENIGGTSAQICEGQTYTLDDLFHGLMLPSGNDASLAIAVWGGKVLFNEEYGRKKKIYYQKFISEMNKKARELGMQKTTYANSHGLVNFANKSCAFDLAILCEYAMKNQKFKSIVSCKFYRTTITFIKMVEQNPEKEKKVKKKIILEKENDTEDDEKDLNSEEETQVQKKVEYERDQRRIQWQNTHSLLHQRPSQYIGIKTGITTAAGPCLASCVCTKQNRIFIIIVLGCEKLSMRFKDTEKLKKWTYNAEGIRSPRKKRKQLNQLTDKKDIKIEI